MSANPAVARTSSPSTIWLGLDVHKESVTIAVDHDRLPNDLPVEQSHG